MNQFFSNLLAPASAPVFAYAIAIMRIAIGILTIGHGIPKMGGIDTWYNIGTTFMYPLGIYFWPTVWGFLAGCTEFFGGIGLVLGFGMRIANFALIIMMIIATAWHIQRGDPFNVYSFPLSLIFVYLFFFMSGGDKFSLDYYLWKQS